MIGTTQRDQLAVIAMQQIVGADLYEAPDVDSQSELKEYGQTIAAAAYAVADGMIAKSKTP
jgi:hypothetical protein